MNKDYENGYNAAIQAIKASLSNQNNPDSSDGIPLDPKMTPPPGQENQSQATQKPGIGTQGNSDIQNQENEEREKNAYTDDEGKIIDKSSNKASSNQSSKQNKLSNNKDNSNDKKPKNQSGSAGEGGDGSRSDANDSRSSSGNAGNSKGQLDKNLETGDIDVTKNKSPRYARGIQIQQELDKLTQDNTFKDETTSPVNRDIDRKKEAERRSEIKRYTGSTINKFKDSLNKFIRDEVLVGKDKTWSRLNKNAVAFGTLKKGTTRSGQNKVPLINVYFDNSGSWDSEKIEVGQKAVATLNKYVQRREIIIRLYYFSTYITNKPQDGGGTAGQPILEHIQKTKPNNVIVMTDSDISDCTSNVVVDGAVWFLFKDGRSQNLVDHLHGKKLTKEFEI